MNNQLTIYALSSGQGRAGIAVIRVSGPRARDILVGLAGNMPAPRMASLRLLRTVDRRDVVDQAMVLWLPEPGTVTGEDMVEFHVHGSSSVVAALFAQFALFDSVVPAEAGAFTRRAFENGRMDLVEVEGLADLLGAQTEVQRRLAMRQFLGEASSVYEEWRSQLIKALALLEAAIDFVDEHDVEKEAWKQVEPNVRLLRDELIEAVAVSGKAGAVRDGLKLVIAGPPNVGKSSLMNWLVGRDVAIVSTIPGTTRDVVERVIDFHGCALVVSDTAGIRDAGADLVEADGMERAKREVGNADILVWMTAPDIISTVVPERVPDIFIVNKSDLNLSRNRNDGFDISVKSGFGLDQLTQNLKTLIQARIAVADDAVVVRDRHVVAVRETIRLLNDALENSGRPIEIVAEDLRKATRSLASITGRIDVEDLLGKIFSEFCIGK